MRILPEPTIFEWDKGNIDKNLEKHNVSNKEAEDVFLDTKHKFIFYDDRHSSETEKRYMIWGETDKNRKLTIFFTIREDKVRVISARDMNKKERREYEKKIKANTKV